MVSLDAAKADAATSAAATTVGEWLVSLQPTPPAALATRLSELLAPFESEPVERVSDVCLEAGERLLEALLSSGSTSRGTALDLLAVDALVTYAFQAGADQPQLLEARAARAMERIAALPVVARE